MPFSILILFHLLILSPLFGKSKVEIGIERLIAEESFQTKLKGKKLGLVTNHTAIDHSLCSTIKLLKKLQKETDSFKMVALFAPEHGLLGLQHAGENVESDKDEEGLPIFSLHGSSRRPTKSQLKDIDILIFDIQDIGSRSYTYISTLFYVMEEAAKNNIEVMVLDRPNPIGGNLVDGIMLDNNWRSFLSYINIPYCHGMTVCELAQYFNKEYKIGCNLILVPMKGWKRSMTFVDTDLCWVPTSPQIPEPDTPFFYPATGLLGELNLVNIGIGYTLPFKVVAAPWIDADLFCKTLNEKKFSGVLFRPIHFRPFWGSFAKKDCHGIQIVITDKEKFKPVEVQYLLIGTLKGLYPERFEKALKENTSKKEMFCKASGTDKVYKLLCEEKFVIYPLKKLCQEARKEFLTIRKKYLIQDYADTSS